MVTDINSVFSNLSTTWVRLNQAQSQKAIEYLRQGYVTAHEIGDRLLEMTSLNSLAGTCDLHCGLLEHATLLCEHALALAHEIDSRPGELFSLGHLGLLYAAVGRFKEAIECFEKITPLAREIKLNLSDIILLHFPTVDLKSFDNGSLLPMLIEQVLPLIHQASNSPVRLRSSPEELLLLGNQMLERKQQINQALEFNKQALAKANDLKLNLTKAFVAEYIKNGAKNPDVNLTEMLQNFSKSIEEKFQVNMREIEERNNWIQDNIIWVQDRTADLVLKSGELEAAIKFYQVRIHTRADDAFNAYTYLGIIARQQGKKVEAQAYFTKALVVWEKAWEHRLQPPSDLLEIKALALLGLGQIEPAITLLKETLSQRKPSAEMKFSSWESITQRLEWSQNDMTKIAQLRALMNKLQENG